MLLIYQPSSVFPQQSQACGWQTGNTTTTNKSYYPTWHTNVKHCEKFAKTNNICIITRLRFKSIPENSVKQQSTTTCTYKLHITEEHMPAQRCRFDLHDNYITHMGFVNASEANFMTINHFTGVCIIHKGVPHENHGSSILAVFTFRDTGSRDAVL